MGARTDQAHHRPPKDLEWTERVNGRESAFVLAPSRLGGIPLLVFASLWDSFFVMLWMGLSKAHAPERAFLFPIAHAVVGVVVTYLALVRCLNVIRITVSPAELVLAQSPIPARGVRLPIATIDHFEVPASRPSRKARGVRAVMKDGAPAIDLPMMLDALDELAFVAGRMNAALAAVRDRGRVTPEPT